MKLLSLGSEGRLRSVKIYMFKATQKQTHEVFRSKRAYRTSKFPGIIFKSFFQAI